MTLLSVMVYITVFIVITLLVRTGVLHLLVWIKPNGFVRLNFIDADGNHHSRDVKIGKDADSKELVDILKNVKAEKKNAHVRGVM